MKWFTSLLLLIGMSVHAVNSGGASGAASTNAITASHKALIASVTAVNASGTAVVASGTAVAEFMKTPLEILEASTKAGVQLFVDSVEFLTEDVIVNLVTLGTDVVSIVLRVPRPAFESSMEKSPATLSKMKNGEDVAVNTRSLEVTSETGEDTIGYVVFLADQPEEVPVGVVLNQKGEAIYAPTD